MPKMKTFTLDQAHALLPVLQSLLKRAMDDKRVIQQVDKEFQDARHRILLSGGLSVDAPGLTQRRAERDRAMQDAKDALAEIHAVGVQVKDLDIGLLDFPCAMGDEVVLLCWKFGEDRIRYWHGQEEGFKGRKPIDERILRGKKREKPN
ncbi:MAG TPA: DUF2203 domain-containing protein [Candidatus Angelobacter sp.]|nr:DUF2203 domain-containing protein [Candidatus Angelobacter sp.]